MKSARKVLAASWLLLIVWQAAFNAPRTAVATDPPSDLVDCGMGFVCGSGGSVPKVGPVVVTGPEDHIIQVGKDPADANDLGAVAAWGFLEEEAKAYVAAIHHLDRDARITDWARPEIRAYIFARLLNIAQKAAADRTPEEATAYQQLQHLVYKSQLHAAQNAKNQYDVWNASPCSYRWPSSITSNVDEYLTRGSTLSACTPVGGLVTTPASPAFEEFTAVGTAMEYHELIGDPASQSVVDGAITAGAFLGGLVAASVAAAIAGAIIASTASISAIFVTGGALAIFPFAAFGPAAAAAGGAAAGVGGFTAALGIAGAVGIVIFAIVGITLASINVAAQLEIPGKLQAAIDDVSTTPDLTALATTDDGIALISSIALAQTLPDYGNAIRSTPPAHAASDPTFTLTPQAGGPSTEVAALSVADWDGPPAHSVYLSDGWFVDTEAGTAQYATTIHYVNWTGEHWTAGVSGDTFIHTKDGEPNASFMSPEIHFQNASGNVKAVLHGNHVPVIQPTASGVFQQGQTITFNANASDPDGDPVTVTWLVEPQNHVNEILLGPDGKSTVDKCYTDPFNTSNPAEFLFPCPWALHSGTSMTQHYGEAGDFRVNAIVQDSHGATANQMFEVHIANVAPSMTISGSSLTGDEGFTASIDGSITDVGDDVVAVTVDWGDGTTDRTDFPCSWQFGIATGPVPCQGPLLGPSLEILPATDSTPFHLNHVYASDPPSGTTYPVTVTGLDDRGGTTDPVALTATVTNVAPVLTLQCGVTRPWGFLDPQGCFTGHEDRFGEPGTSIPVTGRIVDPGLGADTETLALDWGDGSTDTYHYPCAAGDACPFTLTSPSPITFGNGGPGIVFFVATHTYADPGTYPIGVDLNDGEIAAASGTGTAQINPPRTPQTISFDPITDQTYGDPPITLSATATSGLAVTYGTTGNCSVSGTTLTFSAGGCTVTANQAGNATYSPAAPVDRTFLIAKATASIQLSNLTQVANGTPRTVTAVTTPAGLSGVTITYDDALVAPTAAGSYAVVATLDNANYAAPPATGTLVVKAEASLTLQGLLQTYDGSAHAVTVTTDPPSLSGVVVTYNGSTTPPTNAGSYAVVATLTNAGYVGSTSGTLVVQQREVTITASSPTAFVGAAVPTITGSVTSGTVVAGTSVGQVVCTTSAPSAGGKLTSIGGFGTSCSLGASPAPNPNYHVTFAGGTLSVVYKTSTTLLSPAAKSKWKLGSTVPIKIQLVDASGKLISDSAGASLAQSCAVTFSASGPQTITNACLRYDPRNDTFQYDWKITGTAAGSETITVSVTYPGTTVKTLVSVPITITK